MTFKVLLGLLAAVGVTGTAVYFGTADSPGCSAGGCSAPVAVCPLDESAAPSSCCAAGRSKMTVCCEEGEQAAERLDAVAALTGGAGVAR